MLNHQDNDNEVNLGLCIADSFCMGFSVLLFGFEMLILFRYVFPLRIKSPYIISFYVLLTLLLISDMIKVSTRLCTVSQEDNVITVGEIAGHASNVFYILIGFILSMTMF